ncbi:MAG: hypothetical protein PQJ46_03905, partial [Spirochaetales bacterium]|nr:hypothetical protein [Spirochaetales bacterium]
MIKTGKLSVKNKLLFFIVLCLTATSLFAEQQSTQDEKEQLKVGGYTPEYLFQSAIDNNVQLQLLNVEKSQSEIDVKNAKAKRFPSVDFQTTMSYLNNPLMDPITVTAGEYGSYELNGETILIPSEDIVLYEGME